MNPIKRIIVRFKFGMAAKLIESVDKAMTENKSLDRAARRRFWNEFRKSPSRRKAVVEDLRKRVRAL